MRYTTSLIAPLIPISSLMLFLSYVDTNSITCFFSRTLHALSEVIRYDTLLSEGGVGVVGVSMGGKCFQSDLGEMGRTSFASVVGAAGVGVECAAEVVGRGASKLIPFLVISYQIFYGLLFFSTILVVLFTSATIKRWSDHASLIKMRRYLIMTMVLKDLIGSFACFTSCVTLLIPLIHEGSDNVINVSIGWGFAMTCIIVFLSDFFTLAFERESVEIRKGLEGGAISLPSEKSPLLDDIREEDEA